MPVFRSFWRVCCLAIFSSVLCCSPIFSNVAYAEYVTFFAGDSNNDEPGGTPASGSVADEQLTANVPMVLPHNNEFTLSGYVLSGWSCKRKTGEIVQVDSVTGSNNTFSFTVTDESSTVLCTAQWTACSCREGTGVESGTCNVSVSNNQCVYTWSCNSGYLTFASPYTLVSGTSYTTNCEPIDYSISYYNMASSDIPTGVTLPNTYNIESSTITIPALTPSQRPHETFVGWCEWDNVNNTYNPNACSLNPTIPAGSVGHRYYYARWSCDTGYTTSFNVANNYGGIGLDILNNGTSASVSGDVWSVFFGNDDPEITLSGIGMCSDANAGYYPYQFVTMQELNAAYVDGYKEMCWCKLSGYSYDGESQNLSTDFWVYNGGTSHCTQASCQAKCLEYTKEDINDQRERLLFASNVCEPNRYHIIYNQGTQAATMPDPDIVYYGDTYTLAAAPSATGYTFTGWSCPNLPHATVQQNGYYAAGTTPDTNSNTNQPYGYDYLDDVTCTAQWERITHTITFKTGATELGRRTCNEGETVDVSASTIPATTTTFPGATMPVDSAYGWDFDGWTPSVTTNDALRYDTVINSVECDADVTLYGKWGRNIRFVYRASSSNQISDSVHQSYKNTDASTSGVTVVGAPNMPTFVSATNGWEPQGWYVNGSMTIVDSNSSAHSMSLGITDPDRYLGVYKRDVKISYDGNTNTGGNTLDTACTQDQYNYTGSGVTNSPTCTLANNGFTKDGYVFAGWNTAADGTGTSYAEGASYTFPNNTWASSDTVTLYAQWGACSCISGTNVASCSANNPSVVNNTCDYNFVCDTGYNYNGASGGPATATAGNPSVTTGNCGQTTHTITFKTGSTVMGTQTCNEGDTVTLNNVSGMSNIPVSDTYGWSFLGWATQSGTTARAYGNAGTNYVCDADRTLYGVWERTLSFTSYFSANNTGTGTSSPSQRYYNSTDSSAGVNAVTTPPINNFSSSVQGWHPVGWGQDTFSPVALASQSYAPDISVRPNFVAIYERSPQIAYDGNGNTGGSRSNTSCSGPQRHITNGATEEVLGCILGNNGFIKDDYVFTGWNTAADGTGTSYAEGASYTFPNNTWTSSNTATLYAKWQQNAYDITYDCNGGTVVGSNTTPVETFVTRTNAAQYYPSSTYSFETVGSVCERVSYTPQSWTCSYTDSNNTSHTVTTGDTVQPYNVTCLAVWDSGQIILRWEPNNGETIETPNMCTLGGNITNIQQPTKMGYTFRGWDLKRCEIPTADVDIDANAYATKRLDGGSDATHGGATAVTYGISDPGEWGVSWENGDKVTGVALCSQTRGVYETIGTPDETGSGSTRYCWCKATHYTANNTQQCSLLAPVWVSLGGYGSVTACANGCANMCTGDLLQSSGFRAMLFGENVASP